MNTKLNLLLEMFYLYDLVPPRDNLFSIKVVTSPFYDYIVMFPKIQILGILKTFIDG